MNKHEVNLHWDLILALKEGKTIQYFSNSWNKWRDVASPAFISTDKYRIKPEPKSYWFNVYSNGDEPPIVGEGYSTKVDADNAAGPGRVKCVEIVVPE